MIRGGWLFQPLSVVFRKSALDLNMYSKYAIHIDVVLLYAILKNGKGYCMSDVMGIYRIHDAGVWSRLNLNHQRVFSLKARMAIYDVEKRMRRHCLSYRSFLVQWDDFRLLENILCF